MAPSTDSEMPPEGALAEVRAQLDVIIKSSTQALRIIEAAASPDSRSAMAEVASVDPEAEPDTLRQQVRQLSDERELLSKRVNHLLGQIAGMRTVDFDTSVTGRERVDAIIAKFLTFSRQDRSAFLDQLRKYLGFAHSQMVNERVPALLSRYVIIPQVETHLSHRLVLFLRAARQPLKRLPLEPATLEGYDGVIAQIAQIAEGSRLALDGEEAADRHARAEPLAVKEGVPREAEQADLSVEEAARSEQGSPLAQEHAPTLEPGNEAPEPASGPGAVGQPLPLVPELLLKRICAELSIAEPAPFPETLLQATRRLIERGDELARLIVSTNPPGELLLVAPGAPFDPAHHSPDRGSEPDGQVSALIWPGYKISNHVYALAEVSTHSGSPPLETD